MKYCLLNAATILQNLGLRCAHLYVHTQLQIYLTQQILLLSPPWSQHHNMEQPFTYVANEQSNDCEGQPSTTLVQIDVTGYLTDRSLSRDQQI